MLAEIAAAGLAGLTPTTTDLPDIATLSSTLTSSSTTTDTTDTVTTRTTVTAELTQKTNAYRTSQGLHTLTEDPQLNAQAQAWANTVAATNNPIHDPNLAASGAKRENLAVLPSTADPTQAIDRWQASPGHNANLTATNITRVGHGVAYPETGRYAGQPVVIQRFA